MIDEHQQYPLIHAMRWYGPHDAIPLDYIAQAGCTSVVTALHEIPVGEVWTSQEINGRKSIIEQAGMRWDVVESLPVHEDIKLQKGDWRLKADQYCASMRNLADSGVKIITYNFMPLLDWLRTDTALSQSNGSSTLGFNKDDYVVFDLFVLQRAGAKAEYTDVDYERLKRHYLGMTDLKIKHLQDCLLLGLPGSDRSFSLDEIRQNIKAYDGLTTSALQNHLIDFLNIVVPVAESLDIKLAIHPDDPPFSVFGLPRVMSTSIDIARIMDAVPSPSNGLCFCTGSYGARLDNDLPAMIRKWSSVIYFFHLRNTKVDPVTGDFYEADHLSGDTDMYRVLKEIVTMSDQQGRRVVMRPDHGHAMLYEDDLDTAPGYTAIGRLKGLAELRGAEYAIRRDIYDKGD